MWHSTFTSQGSTQSSNREKIQIEKGEVVYRRKENMLCLRWFEKQSVYVLSTNHTVFQSKVKYNYLGQLVIKPVVIQEYNLKMRSVDHSDHVLAHYQTLKSVKWYRKLLLHLIMVNMVVLNSYILNRKYGDTRMTHTCYREYIANDLISTSVTTAQLLRKSMPWIVDNSQVRLTGRHFICKIKCLDGARRKTTAHRYHMCNFTQEQLAFYGFAPHKLPLKFSSFGCSQ